MKSVPRNDLISTRKSSLNYYCLYKVLLKCGSVDLHIGDISPTAGWQPDDGKTNVKGEKLEARQPNRKRTSQEGYVTLN